MLARSHDRIKKRQSLYNAFSRLLQMRKLNLPKLPISTSAKLETCIPEFELYVVVPQGVLVPFMVLPTDLLFPSVIQYSIGPLQFLWVGPLF
jgi:hypothetical protein